LISLNKDLNMAECQFFRVDDGIPLLIDHEFVLDNPYELLVREKTTKDIFLRFNNWEWGLENLDIVDYLNARNDSSCYDSSFYEVYIVPFNNFGVCDYKFIFTDIVKNYEIFMTTDAECDSTDRPIIFNNFEVFDKPTNLGDITATVKYNGIVFNTTNNEVVDTSHPEEFSTLSFTNQLEGSLRICLYECNDFKNGSVDFDVLQRSTGIMRFVGGIDKQQSDFSVTKICQKRHSYYTDNNLGFSLILFEDREQKLLEIYKAICNMVGSSINLTQNMKNDLELMLLRWFSERFNTSNRTLLIEIIRLHKVVDGFIDSAYTVRHIVGNASPRNSTLYK